MKNIFKTLIFISFAAGCFTALFACSGNRIGTKATGAAGVSVEAVSVSLTDSEKEKLIQSLDEIAELERAGSWLQGMALTESSIREQIGDFPGAVAAAYKELALSYGRGIIQKQDVEQGLLNLLELKGDKSVADAANAILAFSRSQWEKAGASLAALFDKEEEPDSFANWMLLVCALEKNSENRQASPAYASSGHAREGVASNDRFTGGYTAANAYRSMRARYGQYPEYWYRGARAFSGAGSAIAAEYAENCINSSPHGPFANECRKILAEFTGLKSEDGLSIRTKREIEFLVSQSVNSGDPQMLDSLLPLIGLPDNPYTVYAVGALKILTSAPKFREYFSAQASVSRGRLAERLLYISRS